LYLLLLLPQDYYTSELRLQPNLNLSLMIGRDYQLLPMPPVRIRNQAEVKCIRHRSPWKQTRWKNEHKTFKTESGENLSGSL